MEGFLWCIEIVCRKFLQSLLKIFKINNNPLKLQQLFLTISHSKQICLSWLVLIHLVKQILLWHSSAIKFKINSVYLLMFILLLSENIHWLTKERSEIHASTLNRNIRYQKTENKVLGFVLLVTGKPLDLSKIETF